jgi:cysteine desulfurase
MGPCQGLVVVTSAESGGHLDTIYLDYQASTPIDPRVAEAVSTAMLADFANPSSEEHWAGWGARKRVEDARSVIAESIGSDSDEIIFTSGATEADNLGVLGAALGAPAGRRRVLVGATEHKAVIESAYAAVERGFTVELIPVDANGLINMEVFEALIGHDVAVVSVMAVNNEIGTIQPLTLIRDLTFHAGAFFHTDATQAPAAMPIAVHEWGVDAASFSGHKIYGPKGVGALYLSGSAPWKPVPLLHGGGQESGLRPGTVPTPLCVGLAEAFRLMASEGKLERKLVGHLRNCLIDHLRAIAPAMIVSAEAAERHPGSLHVRFPTVDARDLLSRLQPSVAASSGSACTSGYMQNSHVLRAIGLDEAEARAGIRLSLGRFTSKAEIDRAAEAIAKALVEIAKT